MAGMTVSDRAVKQESRRQSMHESMHDLQHACSQQAPARDTDDVLNACKSKYSAIVPIDQTATLETWGPK